MIQFPKDFLWGAGTSAHQVEGNNINSDWWEWEKKAGLKDLSAQACRHYELYRDDFELARRLGHNAHRLSVEWARIQPQEGQTSTPEISHYRDVVYSLKERNLEPVITLHHFTNPAWFSRLGGWLNKDAHKYFLRYTETIVDALSDSVHYWVTINEPMVYIYNCYIKGLWPPQERSFIKAKQATENLITAHIKAYKLIHSIYKKKGLPIPAVSIAKNMQPFEACSPTLRNNLSVYLRDRAFNYNFLNKLVRERSLDFIGLNYYSRTLVDTRGWAVKNFFLDTCEKAHSKLPKNSLGWDIYPHGLYKMLIGLKKFRLPVFILENGICTENDSERWDFIRAHLEELRRAMQEGVPVLGYLYWSLIDNFEWDKGFAPRFGLIQVDYDTYRRTPRQSADKFAQVCKSGILE